MRSVKSNDIVIRRLGDRVADAARGPDDGNVGHLKSLSLVSGIVR